MEKLYKHPWIIVLIIACITIFLALQIPRLELDNNNFRFISDDDPARVVSSYIDETFGSSVFILVAFERKSGDVFDPAFLSRIRDYVERIEAIEIVEPVTSIVNADYITGDSESIVVEKLLPGDFAGTEAEIVQLKEKILSWDMYRRSLVSDDFSSTQVLVPLDVSSEDSGRPEVVDSFIQVRDIAREMFAGSAEVYVTGIPVISATINEAMRRDLVFLVPLVVIVVLVILFLSFSKLSGVVLPLLTVVIAVIWSMGVMSLCGIKLSVISTVLPVILVAVGSAYGIHVLTHHLETMTRTASAVLDKTQFHALVVSSVTLVAKPVLLAALTTLAGFLSFCFTTVLPIREFGVFSGFGVLVSFAVSLSLVPSLLIIAGPPKVSKEPRRSGALHASHDRFGTVVSRVFLGAAEHTKAVLVISCFVVVISLLGASRLIIDNVFVEYFKSNTDIARSDRFIREQFGGGKIVSVVAEAETSETLLHPDTLTAMENLNRYLEANVPETGKAMGFTDLVKRINQVFNADESPGGIRPAFAGRNDLSSESTGIDENLPDLGFGFDEDASDFGFGFDGGNADFGFNDDSDFKAAEEARASEPAALDAEAFTPQRLYTMEDMIALLSKASRSGKSTELSAGELLRELQKLVNFEGAAYYEVPANPVKYGKTMPEELASLVSNYLILLSGNIDDYANDPLEPTAIKTTVQLRTTGEADTLRAVDAIYSFVNENFPKNVTVTVGGSALIETSLNRQVVNSQIISLFISLVLVFLIIAVSNRSVAAGLIGIVPLSVSILINFAIMGFLGIKLNLGTSMIASLAVGIGIDYTIHYMESFKRENYDPAVAVGGSRERRDFLARTFSVVGKAIIINALSVGAGFAVLILSSFIMLRDFGLLVALTMMLNALVSLTVIPALLLTFKPAFVRRIK